MSEGLETNVELYLVNRVKARGGLAPKQHEPRGVPDRLVIYRGRYIWCEVKRNGGRVSFAQKKCHEALRQAGCEVMVIRGRRAVTDDLMARLDEVDAELDAR